MDLGIKGKNALVCGASKGMGRAISKALASEGVNVFLCARGEDALKQLAEELKSKSGVMVQYLSCDLSDHDSRSKLVAAASKAFNSIDIVIHNTAGPKASAAMETTFQDWREGYSRLFESVAHLNELLAPALAKQKWGRIVCVTSTSVIEPIPGLVVSNGMRAAVTGMLKTLADELAPFAVTVNCVAPGSIDTERLNELMNARVSKTKQNADEYMNSYLAAIPAGRLGTPEEFAATVTFLCSQQASYITGSTICVDGGKRRSTV